MKEKETYYISVEFEHLLTFLFGRRNYHGFAGEHDLKSLKLHFAKVFNAIQKSIQLNVNSDILHKEDLINLCKTSKSSINSAHNISHLNLISFEYLTKIVFQLMGQMPNNWEKGSTSHPKSWTLAKYRSIVSTATYEQKANLIIDATYRSKFNQIPKRTELLKLLNIKFKNNYQSFVEWFREEYPVTYSQIF